MSNELDFSSIFLTIICAVILIVSIVSNLCLLITLLKVNRLRLTDRSNYFLTHLIFVDLISTIFIIIPSGLGVYNQGDLDPVTCHVQTYFMTFNFTMTFHGLLLLAVDRYLRFFNRKFHDKSFKTENNSERKLVCLKTSAFIVPLWILDCIISFIPLFGNFSDQQYFTVESQCDYIYEKFLWWLWFIFFIGLIIPFVAALVLFIITLMKIREFLQEVKKKRADKTNKVIGIQDRTKSKFYNQKRDKSKDEILKIHDKDNDGRFDADSAQSSKTIRELYNAKLDRNDAMKTLIYFIMLILSFIFVFPIYVVHFYRTYSFFSISSTNTTATTSTIATTTISSTIDYDLIYDLNNPDWTVYTAFAWISYLNFIVKSLVAFIADNYYRDAFYQAANIRGFRGKHHYEYDKKAENVKEIDAEEN